MKLRLLFVAAFAILIAFIGCAPKVMVPPRIVLDNYQAIGLVEFSSNTEGKLDNYVTQEFFEAITEDQQGVHIIELGSEDGVLADIGHERMSPEAITALGEKYTLKTIVTGVLDVGKPSTGVDFWGDLTSITVSTEVSATLTVKMRDAATGATVWTGSATDEREVSDVGFWGGFLHFDAEDPDRAYGKLVDKLVKEVTKDFRVTWERKR